jgi:lipoprotein-releasing system permease protein
MYAFCGIDVIRKLNKWNENEAGGIELMISNLDLLDVINERVNNIAGIQYQSQTIKEVYPQIFHWLELQNINVVILIVLILLVAGVSMISTLLIIIMENTNLIGTLKTFGIPDSGVRRIFIRIALPVIGIGMLAGNVLGIGLCLLQDQYGIITLPQDSYYVSEVPVNFDALPILLLNVGTLLICLLMLIGPSSVIARITPSNTLKFR